MDPWLRSAGWDPTSLAPLLVTLVAPRSRHPSAPAEHASAERSARDLTLELEADQDLTLRVIPSPSPADGLLVRAYSRAS